MCSSVVYQVISV